jgi:hypothetical protein
MIVCVGFEGKEGIRYPLSRTFLIAFAGKLEAFVHVTT